MASDALCSGCGASTSQLEACERCGVVICLLCADTQSEWYREHGECDDCRERLRAQAEQYIAEDEHDRYED